MVNPSRSFGDSVPSESKSGVPSPAHQTACSSGLTEVDATLLSLFQHSTVIYAGKAPRIWNVQTELLLTKEQPEDKLGDLPAEMLQKIFLELDPKDLGSLARTCKHLHQSSQDGAIWKAMRSNRFGHIKTDNDSPGSSDQHLDFCKGLGTLNRNIKNNRYTEVVLDLPSMNKKLDNRHKIMQVLNGRLYTNVPGRGVEIWDMATGECLRVLNPPLGTVGWFYAVKDRLYTQLCRLSYPEDKVSVWDIKTGGRLATIPVDSDSTSLHVDKGYFYASNFTHRSINIFDAASGIAQGSFEGNDLHKGDMVCMHTFGDHLYTSADDQTVKIWDIQSQTILDTIPFDKGDGDRELIAESLHVIGNLLYIPLRKHGIVKIYDIVSKEWVAEVGKRTDTWVKCPRFFHATEDRLYIASDNSVMVWDAKSLKQIQTFSCPQAELLDFQVVGNHLYMSSSDDEIADGAQMLSVWDVTTTKCLASKKLPGPAVIDQFLAVGSRLVALTSPGNTITIRDFSFPCQSSYPLKLLEENLLILDEMAACEKLQEHKAVAKLAANLEPDFKKRLVEYCLPGNPFSQEGILHVRAEVYTERLFHAIHDLRTSNDEKHVDTLIAFRQQKLEELIRMRQNLKETRLLQSMPKLVSDT